MINKRSISNNGVKQKDDFATLGDVNEPVQKDITDISKFDPFSTEERINNLSYRMNRLFPIKKPTDTVPAFTPKNSNDQVVLYINGADIRVYYWISGTWYYATLT